MALRTFSKWMIAFTLLTLTMLSSAHAQTEAIFTGFNDALAGRCYNPATTLPDELIPNRLNIGIHSGIDPLTWQNTACVASTSAFNPRITMDTISFHVAAPDGFYISKIKFTQTGSTSGSNGGAGFRGATWVVDDDALTVPFAAGGWAATADLINQYKTAIPVSITTYLVAYGVGATLTGSASASNPAVVVELLPLP